MPVLAKQVTVALIQLIIASCPWERESISMDMLWNRPAG